MIVKNTSNIMVIKRNGEKEQLDIDKIHRVVEFACNGISGVSPSEIELKSQIKFFNNMKTTDIQETLIKASSELITEETPNYQYVAGRLINYHLRKEVYGSYEPIHLFEHVKNVVKHGYYTNELLEWYDEKEFEKMDSFIDHDRDDNLVYVAMEQFRGKYLVKNRVTGKFYETPQMAYMLISATIFHDYPKEKRLKYVRDYYDMISNHYISLATPVMAGVRTPQKQFSSCVLINSGDSLDSITATSTAIVKYVSQKAGIGLNVGRIRALNSPIRNGDAYHTGIIPFLKLFHASIKSCSQGSVRGGAGTVYYPFWHLEVEDLLVLKNNKGTEENRIRHMDYGIQFNKLFYERVINNEHISLFCPNDVPELYEYFFTDQDEFKQIYERCERNTRLRKKKILARDLFNIFVTERKDTGRIYLMNVDNVNLQSPFDEKKSPIYQSNLCAEIVLPTTPMDSSGNGLIALCTLSAINWGKINSPDDLKKPCEMAVRGLDALLTYQDYPLEEARNHTKFYRPLGIGITNLAYFLAKNNLTYEGNQETYDTVRDFIEAQSYYLIKTSVELAKEYGACLKSDETMYGKGLVPRDYYKKDVDEIVSNESFLEQEWRELKTELKTYGIRNATLMAIMPCESSSQVLNSTNGIEPPRAYVMVKSSKDGALPQIIPEYPRLKNKYQLLWDIKSPEGYLKICAVIQKFVDNAISVNTSYNPKHYEKEEIPMSVLQRHILLHYKWGGKTLYYNNTYDGQGEIEIEEKGCSGGACTL